MQFMVLQSLQLEWFCEVIFPLISDQQTVAVGQLGSSALSNTRGSTSIIILLELIIRMHAWILGNNYKILHRSRQSKIITNIQTHYTIKFIL